MGEGHHSEAKTAMKTMSTRAMKAKKAKTALKTMSKKPMQAMKAKKVGRLGIIDFALSVHEDREIGAPPPQRRKYFSGVIVMRSA